MKIVKFYTLFSTQQPCVQQHIPDLYKPNTSKRAPLFSLELVLGQKHSDSITDIIRITPFFTAEIRVWKI